MTIPRIAGIYDCGGGLGANSDYRWITMSSQSSERHSPRMKTFSISDCTCLSLGYLWWGRTEAKSEHRAVIIKLNSADPSCQVPKYGCGIWIIHTSVAIKELAPQAQRLSKQLARMLSIKNNYDVVLCWKSFYGNVNFNFSLLRADILDLQRLLLWSGNFKKAVLKIRNLLDIYLKLLYSIKRQGVPRNWTTPFRIELIWQQRSRKILRTTEM